MDLELRQLDERGSRKKVYEWAFVQQTAERAKKKKELEALMQMITTQENTRNLMRNSARTTMPPLVNVDGSNESVQSADSKND